MKSVVRVGPEEVLELSGTGVETRPVVQLSHRQLIVIGEQDTLGDVGHPVKLVACRRPEGAAAPMGRPARGHLVRVLDPPPGAGVTGMEVFVSDTPPPPWSASLVSPRDGLATAYPGFRTTDTVDYAHQFAIDITRAGELWLENHRFGGLEPRVRDDPPPVPFVGECGEERGPGGTPGSL